MASIAEALELQSKKLRSQCKGKRSSPLRAAVAVARCLHPAFELIPPRQQFGSVQIVLMPRWFQSAMSLRGFAPLCLEQMKLIELQPVTIRSGTIQFRVMPAIRRCSFHAWHLSFDNGFEPLPPIIAKACGP
jgi:hypothetical protein